MFQRQSCKSVVGIAALVGIWIGSGALAYTTPSSTTPNPNAAANQAKQQQMAAQRKQLEDARAAVDVVRKQMAKVRARVEATFTSKDEYATAKKDYEAAQSQYDAASKPAIAAARKKPEYLQAVADREKAQKTIDQANKPTKPDDSATSASASESGSGGDTLSQDDIKAAVDTRWKAGTTIHQIEADALAEDPKVDAAKSKRDEAKRAWEAAQAQVTEAVEADPEYIQLQTQFKAADQQLTTIKQNIAAQQKAAEAAAAAQRSAKAPSSTPPRR